MWITALSFLKNYFSDVKNIAIAVLIIIVIGLNINIYFKNNTIENKEKEIVVLNAKVVDLSFKLDKQNLAIEELNKKYESSKNNFQKQYKELEKKQAPKIKYLEKQKEYKSPEGISELDASRKVLKDFLGSRK